MIRTSVTRALPAAILIAGTTWAGSAAQQQPPPCADNPELDRTWSAAWTSLGVQASAARMPLGDVAAKRWFGEGNWYPVDGANQTMCGTLRDWSVYDGRLVTPHELDLHPYISPSSDFRFLIEDLPEVARDNTFVCRIGNDIDVPCVWGEVTTVAAIGRKLLGASFPRITASDKPYLGNAACMFGPWVMERVHGWRTEIHPYRVFWAAKNPTDGAVVDILFARDSTQRYATRGDFVAVGPRPGAVWNPRAVDETVGIAWEIERDVAATITVEVQEKYGDPQGTGTGSIDHQFGAARLHIGLPDWMTPVAAQACSADRTGRSVIRGLDQVGVKIDLPWNAQPFEGSAALLRLTRTNAGVPPVDGLRRSLPTSMLRVSSTPQRRLQESQVPPSNEPTLRLRVLGIEPVGSVTRTAELQRAAREWHLTDRVRDWRVSSNLVLHVRPYYAGTGRAEDAAERLNDAMEKGNGPAVTIYWSFTADGWDNSPAPTLVVAQSEAPFFYGVRGSGGDRIVTRLELGRPLRSRPQALVRPGSTRWDAEIAIASPTNGLLQQNPLSGVLHITATLRDTDGRTSSQPFRFDVYSHMPDLGDVRPAQEPPEPFMTLVAGWLAKERPDVNVPIDEIRGALGRDGADETNAAVTSDATARRARIFRLQFLRAVEDNEIDADELQELLRMAKAWIDSRWSLPAPR